MGAGVTWARGGSQTVMGSFAAEWEVGSDGAWKAKLNVPVGTVGTIYVPLFGLRVEDVVVMIDGVEKRSTDVRHGFLRVGNVGAGEHRITLEPERP